MLTLKMTVCGLALLLVAGCGSRAPAQPLPGQCPPPVQPPAPPAWTMQPPSNSLLLLDATFSTSEPASSPTKQP